METITLYIVSAIAVLSTLLAFGALRDLRVLARRIEEITDRITSRRSHRFPASQMGKRSFWRLESLRHRLSFLESKHAPLQGLHDGLSSQPTPQKSLDELIEQFAGGLPQSFLAASYMFAYRRAVSADWVVGSETVGHPTVVRDILSSLNNNTGKPGLTSLYGYSFFLQERFSWNEGEVYDGCIWLGFPASQPPLEGSEKALAAKVRQFTLRAENRYQVQMLADQIDTHVEELRGKSDFLNHISHDLRTPLSNVRTVLQLFQLEGMKDDSAELLECALRNCDKVTGLLEDVIGFAELQNGKLQSVSADFSLGELIDEVVILHQPRAREKNIVLSSVSSQTAALLNSDRQHVFRILNNLVENAIKYTAAGSVTIEPLEEATATSILVRDTGCGISVNDFSRIFAPFERHHRNSKGAGLGLTICKNLADLHGYMIKVDSSPGQGSTFTLTMPRIPRDKTLPVVLALPTQLDSPALSVAVFHSNQATSRSIIRCLAAYGIAADNCDSVESLLDRLRSRSISELIIEKELVTPLVMVEIDAALERRTSDQVIVLMKANEVIPQNLKAQLKYLHCPNSFEQIAALILSKAEKLSVKRLA